MEDIANILFDFGNVIIDIDIDGAKQRIGAMRRPDVPEEEFEQHIYSLISKYEVDAISDSLFINGVLKYSKRDIQARDVIDAWNSMLVGIPPFRLQMLEQLRQNYSLFMLSNTNFMHIAWVHDHLERVHGVEDFEVRYFDEVYYSHLIKARKPNKDSFEYVAEDAMITPAKTLFIDDTEENIAAAAELGFQTLLSPSSVEIAETLKLMGMY